MTPAAIVKKMMENDAFSQWLSIKIVSITEGECQLESTVTKSMVNGFLIAHGGITYSLADSALAFAANSYGKQCVSIETSISHVRPARIGDTLVAHCKELNRTKTLGRYEVTITNQDNKIVALFKGTVHISSQIWQ